MPQLAEQRLQRAEAALEKQRVMVLQLQQGGRPAMLEMAERLQGALESNVAVARETLHVQRVLLETRYTGSDW
jgi:hypothetical protein